MDYSKEFLKHAQDFYNMHKEGEVFITEKVSFIMKNILKRARKNYLGIYDEPLDPVTGQEKIWPPLTETFVDSVRKSIDFDTKDIQLVSRNSTSYGSTKVMEVIVRNTLEKIDFGKTLNEFAQYIATDGIGVMKFIDGIDPDTGKRVPKIKTVDNLNIVTDETRDIHTSSAVIEYVPMSYRQLKDKKGVWDKFNKIDEVLKKTQSQAPSTTLDITNYQKMAGPQYPIFEYWGQMKKGWITGKKGELNEWVEGHAIIYGLDKGDGMELIFIEETKKRPYIEAILKKVIGRRIGRGVAEVLFGMQKYLNMIMDTRRRNALILQNGLFKAKRKFGDAMEGILSKITAGGIIEVEEQDDFEQMDITDSRASSYSDEDRIVSWGERATGAYDIRRGEQMAASAPATMALIQDRNSRDLFQLAQENIAFAIEEMIREFLIPWIVKNVQNKDIVCITGSPKDIDELDNTIIDYLINKKVTEYIEQHSRYPEKEEVMKEKERLHKKFRKLGNKRYVELKKGIFSEDCGVRVVITNETIDRPTVVRELKELLTIAVSNPGTLDLNPQGILDEIFSHLDIPEERIYNSHRPNQDWVQKMEYQKKIEEAMDQNPDLAKPNPTRQPGSMNAIKGRQAMQPNQQGPRPANPGTPGGVVGIRQTGDNTTQLGNQ